MDPYPPYGNAERKGEGIQVFGTHRLMMGRDGSGGASMARKEMDSMFSPVHIFVTSQKQEDISNFDRKVNNENENRNKLSKFPFKKTWFSAISSELPPNLMLITF